MSNPNKQWSWKGAAGRATGTAMQGATMGAINGALGGPLGVPVGVAVGASVGFVFSMVGSGLGHWWDDIDREPETFGSGALYSLVVGGLQVLPAMLLLQQFLRDAPEPVLAFVIVISLVSVVTSASKSLIDDLHHAYFASATRPTNDNIGATIKPRARGTLS